MFSSLRIPPLRRPSRVHRFQLQGRARRDRFRPRLEALEDRTLLSANTYTLNLIGDAGTSTGALSGDIRYCINQADNPANAGSTVTFDMNALGTNPVISLTSSELVISDNMTIVGPGAASLTIKGDPYSRVFDIYPSATQVAISGLTITGGALFDGCGIYNAGSLTVSDCTVSGNSDPNVRGGGIYNVGTLAISDSTLSGNSAVSGGGIFNAGNLTISDSTLSGNSAAENGGGIYNDGSSPVVLTNVTLADNTSGLSGGGMYFASGTATLHNTLIAGNLANGRPSDVFGSLDPASDYNLVGDGSGRLDPALHNQLGSPTGPIFSYTTISVPGATDTGASGINEAGQIVGYFTDSTGVEHGFLKVGSIYTTLDVPGASATSAYGIDDAGRIVGSFTDASGKTHGFFRDGSTYTTLDVPGASSTSAYGINAAGQIVGPYNDAVGRTHSFLKDGTTYTTFNHPSAGTATPHSPGGETVAGGIDSAGRILGFYNNVSGDHGFLKDGSTYTSFDVPGVYTTDAYGINEAGQIVGLYSDVAGTHGFFKDGSSYTTLDVPGAGSTNQARGINDAGLIVGSYKGASGHVVGFLATSVPQPPPQLLNPLLAPLSNYGGATQTMDLLPGSPALDKGSNAYVTSGQTDQRGLNRIVGSSVDIGAVESQGFSLFAVAGSGQSTPINTGFATPLQALVTENGHGLPGVSVTFTAPASGPSGSFAGPATVITNAAGVAIAPPFTANGTMGSYLVTASAAGIAAPVEFTLSNSGFPQTVFNQLALNLMMQSFVAGPEETALLQEQFGLTCAMAWLQSSQQCIDLVWQELRLTWDLLLSDGNLLLLGNNPEALVLAHSIDQNPLYHTLPGWLMANAEVEYLLLG